jgi:hypothetical protein
LLQQWQDEARVKVDAWEKGNKHADGAPEEKGNPKTQGKEQ